MKSFLREKQLFLRFAGGDSLEKIAADSDRTHKHIASQIIQGACCLRHDNEEALRLWDLFSIPGNGYKKTLGKFREAKKKT